MRQLRLGLAGAVVVGAFTLVLPASAASAVSPRGKAPSVTYFVIGDGSAVTGAAVTFWGAQWWKENVVSGGAAPASFKGFVDTVTFSTSCTGIFTAAPGNSSSPPAAVGSVVVVLVADSVSKHGPVVSGSFVNLENVGTNPGYAPDPGHPGTGTVLGSTCGGNPH